MKITGIHKVTSPFKGHGVLTINGQSTDNLRNRTLIDCLMQLNAMTTGVIAAVDSDGYLSLEADEDFTVGGNQDVLDVFGIEATPEPPAA